MGQAPPASVGLGGDGDEVAAIQEVERVFGVKLDDAEAPNWHTAGDVFASLRRALPSELREDSGVWERFTEALSEETGVDPRSIELDSPLLSDSRIWVHISNVSAIIWLTLLASVLLLAVWFLAS